VKIISEMLQAGQNYLSVPTKKIPCLFMWEARLPSLAFPAPPVLNRFIPPFNSPPN
jgi:hypothetical protein